MRRAAHRHPIFLGIPPPPGGRAGYFAITELAKLQTEKSPKAIAQLRTFRCSQNNICIVLLSLQADYCSVLNDIRVL